MQHTMLVFAEKHGFVVEAEGKGISVSIPRYHPDTGETSEDIFHADTMAELREILEKV